jgi:hypothetical protein
MQNVYRDISSFEASMLFYAIFFVFMSMNVLFYPLAFYSLVSKKVKYLKFFSSLSLYTSIITIFIIYINILFIFVFLLRLIVYGITRFVVNLLVSLLILPRTPTLIATYENENYNTI